MQLENVHIKVFVRRVRAYIQYVCIVFWFYVFCIGNEMKQNNYAKKNYNLAHMCKGKYSQ